MGGHEIDTSNMTEDELVVKLHDYKLLPQKRIAKDDQHNRWMVAIAAVIVHLCVGSIYAWSVYDKELSKSYNFGEGSFAGTYTFPCAIALLGLSASFAGAWMEIVGPNVTSLIAGFCWGIGLCIGALGYKIKSQIIIVLGIGLLGGCGLGLAYISPVSTLVKWFPDRRGLATGLAVMGFGGGASIASITQRSLISRYDVGVSMLVHGIVYGVLLVVASLFLYVPKRYDFWPPYIEKPKGQENATHIDRAWCSNEQVTCCKPKGAQFVHGHISLKEALKTKQFYMMWFMLFINIAAGIGVISKLSPLTAALFDKDDDAAAQLVSFASIFNALGRFLWAAASDYLGRRTVFGIFGGLGAVCFYLITVLSNMYTNDPNGMAYDLFYIVVAITYTMYGGGFACIPAFLADIFGSKNVGAIHGVILTAWSLAGVVGPIGLSAWKNSVHDLTGRAYVERQYYPVIYTMSVALLIELVLALWIYPLTDKDVDPSIVVGENGRKKEMKAEVATPEQDETEDQAVGIDTVDDDEVDVDDAEFLNEMKDDNFDEEIEEQKEYVVEEDKKQKEEIEEQVGEVEEEVEESVDSSIPSEDEISDTNENVKVDEKVDIDI
eukprot:TRINITY_DN2690_c0_g1_i2.p1 TRINITY_DN2690_c0_g1~~TRINITY_DN2690_c0_g1_i2.p1  ORF type:complete len:606 (+),score=188.94 TRINITY_DN2690_c0_g1_i2:165-1982(+)